VLRLSTFLGAPFPLAACDIFRAKERLAMIVLECTLKFLGCIVLVDFLSGLVHWLEDAYGQPDWPISGKWITQPNILHHHDGRHFIRHSWAHRADALLLMGGMTVMVCYCLGCLNWMVWLVVLVGVNANEFHKWAHCSKAENGRLITLLHRLRILQTPAHHAHHHRGGKNTHYCVVTNFVNPILDAIRLWDILEWVVFQVTRVPRRNDDSLKSVGS
jgi:ubiquitin-conjugating enzyme E2 variant